ncbi:response regulator [bacterium]|nr:response regulator [bacterium]
MHLQTVSNTPKKILLVEDSENLCQVITKRAQKKFGYSCRVDNTGENCIQLCREEKPDVLILDMGLPKVSGLSLLRMIKQDSELQNIPVIAYTAYSYHDLVAECADLGIDAYFTKSEPISELFDLIQNQINKTQH